MPHNHGLLLVNKPSGITSHDVVQKVRRSLSLREVGHAGTLDPLAEGLMVVLLGEATKLSTYVLEQDKEYEVLLQLGQQSDTLDATGTIIGESPVMVNQADVESAAKALEGEWLWDIPLYSAKKVDGEKLYEKARKGDKPIVLPQKSMKFWNIREVSGDLDSQQYRFRLNCSKGSFIRSWVDQLGKNLGCGALMVGLKRLASNPYHLEDAVILEDISLDQIKKGEQRGFKPLMKSLPHVKTIKVSGITEGLIRNGQISHDLKRRLISIFDPEKDQIIKIISQRPEVLLALVGLELEKGFVVRRVFRY